MPDETSSAPVKQSVTMTLDDLRHLIRQEARKVAKEEAVRENRTLLNEIRRAGKLLQSVAEVGLGMTPGKSLPPAPRQR
jgi:hypothetical protein